MAHTTSLHPQDCNHCLRLRLQGLPCLANWQPPGRGRLSGQGTSCFWCPPPFTSNLESGRIRWIVREEPNTPDLYTIQHYSCPSFLATHPCGGAPEGTVRQNILFDTVGPKGKNHFSPNAQWQLVPTGQRENEYYFRSFSRGLVQCASYMSVQSCGGNDLVDIWGGAGVNQAFILDRVE